MSEQYIKFYFLEEYLASVHSKQRWTDIDL